MRRPIFHDYGVLWKVPVGFEDPMYMIVNLAIGSKYFGGVGIVDGTSPVAVEFEIDGISAYQIDP